MNIKTLIDLLLYCKRVFEAISSDERLTMAHLCIYNAILQCWNENDFSNPVKITRREIMRLSKVKSKTTYHKCIRDLQAFGYINYEPSFKPQGSSVYILTYEPKNMLLCLP